MTCDICLPIETAVKSVVTRETPRVTRQGLQNMLILTSETAGGVPAGSPSVIDAATRTKRYFSLDDVASDWDAASQAYQAALTVFSQNPSPNNILIGWYDAGGNIQTELDALTDCTTDWVFLVAADIVDDAKQDSIAAWIEARDKIYVARSNDAATYDLAASTDVTYRFQQAAWTKSLAIYSSFTDQYPDAALAAKLSSIDLDEAASSYTAYMQDFAGITPETLTRAQLRVITGFDRDNGRDSATGKYGNVYVCVGGANGVHYGQVASGEYIDEIHYSIHLEQRAAEAVYGAITAGQKLPYTADGIIRQIDALEAVLLAGEAAGHITDYQITAPELSQINGRVRADRVGPCISYNANYAGAIHSGCAIGTIFI